jgi:pimeloyl-ACP methyl ester carboxylesterase
MSHSESLGTKQVVELPTARIAYRERGQGRPVVFVHGVLTNGDLWRMVVPTLADAGFRCLTPDWPLGSHDLPVPGADLSPPGVATLIAEYLDALDLDDVTLVANDTGGALVQILMVEHPTRIGRVVLTPCDSFERFFPPPLDGLPRIAKVPGAIWTIVNVLRWRALHRLPIAFGWVTKRPVPPEIADSFLVPSRQNRAVRQDLRRFMGGVHRRYTLDAAARLGEFDKPVLLVWTREDKLFPPSLATRLAAILPNATVELIDDSYTFVPEDQPELLVRLMLNFLNADAAT